MDDTTQDARRRPHVVAAMVAAALALGLVAPAGAPAAVVAPLTGDYVVADEGIFGGTGGLITVAKGNGNRNLLSANGAPPSDPSANFAGPQNLTWEPDGSEHFEGVEGYTGDGTGGAILVADPDAGAGATGKIIRVDPETGERMLVADNTTPGPVSFVDPVDVAVEDDGDIIVVDSGAVGAGGAVIRVNPVSGQKSRVSANVNPAGVPQFVVPIAVAIEESGEILVGDLGAASVIRVDPLLGTRSTASDNGNSGENFAFLAGLPVDAAGIYVSDASAFGGGGGVMEIDPATGDRTRVSSNGNPGGQPNFEDPLDLDVEGTGQIVLVDLTTFLPGVTPGVMRIDPATGDRDRVSENTNPPCCSISFIQPFGIMVKPFSLGLSRVPAFVAGGKPAPVASGTRRGAKLRFTLDERARVLFAVDRRVKGRIADGRCRPETPRNRRGRRCVAHRRVGAFAFDGRKGTNSKRFSGRIGATTLAPGSYRLLARATNRRGDRSARVARTFRVVRG